MSSSLEPELVVDAKCILGEGPLWSPREGRLHWTDIEGKTLYAYSPAERERRSIGVSAKVSAMTLQPDGSRLLFMEEGRLDLRSGTGFRTVRKSMPELKGTRFNDVCAAPDGSVLCTTMPTDGQPSRLYRLGKDGSMSLLLDHGGMFNGMGFTPDAKGVYITDSIPGTITRYDYTGVLKNPRLLTQEPEASVNPDGLAVDEDGFVWSARYGAGRLVRIAPDGTDREVVELPCPHVASVGFGGEALEDLYIVTGREPGDPDLAGGTFRIRPRVPGLPRLLSRIAID